VAGRLVTDSRFGQRQTDQPAKAVTLPGEQFQAPRAGSHHGGIHAGDWPLYVTGLHRPQGVRVAKLVVHDHDDDPSWEFWCG
jgi:hypothetical protein